MTKTRWLLLIPLLLFIPFSSSIDLSITDFFYRNGFYLENSPFFLFFYRYGEYPALLTASASLIVFCTSFLCKLMQNSAFFNAEAQRRKDVFENNHSIFLFSAPLRLWASALKKIAPYIKPYRRIALYLCLLLLLGAGLIINAGLKDHWGRPRPKQTDRYGGEVPFQPFYKPNFDHPEYKSFPSGHVAMGFYFYSLVVIGRTRKNKTLLYFGSAVTSLLGGALALTRIAQGGHYFSDTLFAALIMILCAESLRFLLNEPS